MAFIHEDFLLQNDAAQRLYHACAEKLPIFDFHCHLPVKEIAENRQFHNLAELSLEGDHYKWRVMRANGVAERFCSGDAEPYEKFMAWARTVPRTLRNPLYHWTHLELARYFDIFELLDEATAPAIWERANERLQNNQLSAQGILEEFHVVALCTTDDPAGSLEHHEQIERSRLGTRVFPAFRPDRAFETDNTADFNKWTDSLAASANVEIRRLADFLDALRKRHDAFHQHGCRLSDHGLETCYAEDCKDREAEAIFAKLLDGKRISAVEKTKFCSFLMMFFARLDAEKGWTKQLHLGALRNTNTRMLAALGRDSGFDSIGDWPQARALAGYLDRLERENVLPKLILYNLNPAENYVFAAMTANFQGGSCAGKIQFGSAWWFLDQKEGMELQLNALSNCGLLSRFVGMITDSRSFLSFPRHEYFRRILCNLLGDEVEKGLLPKDEKLLGSMIRGICFENAREFLGLPVSLDSNQPEAQRKA
ncbi:MAG: glucuronate isomerase [Candidatus Acidiferrales bacterium]